MTIEDVLQSDILIAGLDDWLALYNIEGFARRAGAPPGGPAKALILRVLGSLAESHLVEFGTVSDDGFAKWIEPPEVSLSRVDRDWDSGEMQRGFRLWLRNSDEGDLAARFRLDERQQDV